MSVGQIRLLARTFFARMFESDLMPDGLPQVQLVLWGTLLAGMPTTGYVMLLRRQMVEGDRLILVTFSMVAMGVVGLVIWDNIFPDRRDVRILGPLPVPGYRFVLARLAALGRLFVLFATAICVPHSIIFGLFGAGFVGLTPRLFGGLAHLTTVVAACIFVMSCLVAAQCLLLLVVGRRSAQAASGVLQVVFAVGLAQLVVFLPTLGSALRQHGSAASSLTTLLFPPTWFFRSYHVLRGTADQAAGTSGQLAPVLTLGSLAVAVGLYAASYKYLSRRALEGAMPQERTLEGVVTRLEQRFRPRRFERPVTDTIRRFTIRTLVRHQAHRMMLALYGGIALALILSTALSVALRDHGAGLWRPGTPLMSMPLIFQFLVLVGIRAIVAIPAEPKARWVFRACEPSDRSAAVSGLRAAMARLVVLPTSAFAALQALVLWSPAAALSHGAFCFVVGTFLSEILILRMAKLPFACTYFPGRSRIFTLWPFYLIAFSIYTFGLAELDRALAARPKAFVEFVVIATLVTQFLVYRRRRGLEAIGALRFEEEEPGAIFKGFDLSEGLAAAPPTPPVKQPAGS